MSTDPDVTLITISVATPVLIIATRENNAQPRFYDYVANSYIYSALVVSDFIENKIRQAITITAIVSSTTGNEATVLI